MNSLKLDANHLLGVLEDTLFYLNEVADDGDDAEMLDAIIRALKQCKEECDTFSRYAGRKITSYGILLNEMKLKKTQK